MREIWKPIPGHEGCYEVSNLGRVRSLDRRKINGHRMKGRILATVFMRNGYQIVTLWRSGVQRTWLVHRLVLLAFIGEPGTGVEALHADGDRTNNRLDNLSWGTHSENQFDQVSHGTHPNASKDRCPLGHLYSENNTYNYPGRAHRACRTCRREYMRKFRQRRQSLREAS